MQLFNSYHRLKGFALLEMMVSVASGSMLLLLSMSSIVASYQALSRINGMVDIQVNALVFSRVMKKYLDKPDYQLFIRSDRSDAITKTFYIKHGDNHAYPIFSGIYALNVMRSPSGYDVHADLTDTTGTLMKSIDLRINHG